MNKVAKTVAVLSVAMLAGCAATYSPPTLEPTKVSEPLHASKSETLAAAKRVLVLEGYQIANSDDNAGIISTGVRQMPLTEADADCGTTAGIPYIKDKRTITRVTVGVVVSDADITVSTGIEGEYLKGNVTAGIDFQCVSTGRIERSILSRINEHL